MEVTGTFFQVPVTCDKPIMSIQIITPYSVRLAVVGGGTMGSGIALAALLAGLYVTLYDVQPEMLARAHGYIDHHLVRKGKSADLARLTTTADLDDLHKANLVIEAVPEELSLKQELFARLDAICPPPAILATNTSTLPVTAIAAAARFPRRVAGMHFFNPASVLPLVEIVRGAQTDPETIQTLVAVAEMLGKTPVVVRDTPGFIVNRVARPFYGEALRLLGEGVASHDQIDLIVRLGGGFKIGPFQLMDLIGIDVNLAATQSMYEQTFGEPRYRPHLIQAQMVQQNALGRKTGSGFYSYDPEPSFEDPPLPRPGLRRHAVYLVAGSWAPGLEELCQQAGNAVVRLAGGAESAGTPLRGALVVIAAGAAEGLLEKLTDLDRRLPESIPILCQCADAPLSELSAGLRHLQRLVGFDGLFLAAGKLATLVASPALGPQARQAAEEFIQGLGLHAAWVAESPALVLPRIVCMLANEAAFAAGEGVAEPETIDQAMQLGVSYPKGPLAWAKELGYGKVVAVLDHLHAEYGEERYRVAPLLRRWARLESPHKEI
jgi:3-hydroxybutyryl-CoA dehydrogenase